MAPSTHGFSQRVHAGTQQSRHDRQVSRRRNGNDRAVHLDAIYQLLDP